MNTNDRSSPPAGRRVQAGGDGGDVTIPVLLDAIRNFDDTPMARCVYVVAESDDPSSGWTLDLENARVPFLMVGISAVLHSGIGGETRFTDPATIEALYQAVESDPTLSIQTSDLWLPVSSIAGDRELSTLTRGQVFRVGAELFGLAQQFVTERLSRTAFLNAARRLAGQVIESPEEADAFRRWNLEQIEYAKEQYPKSEKRRRVPSGRNRVCAADVEDQATVRANAAIRSRPWRALIARP